MPISAERRLFQMVKEPLRSRLAIQTKLMVMMMIQNTVYTVSKLDCSLEVITWTKNKHLKKHGGGSITP